MSDYCFDMVMTDPITTRLELGRPFSRLILVRRLSFAFLSKLHPGSELGQVRNISLYQDAVCVREGLLVICAIWRVERKKAPSTNGQCTVSLGSPA